MTHSVGTGFLCEASPKWLRSRKCHLLGKRREFLGLLGQRRKVLLCKFGRKFHKLRRRLHASHPLGKIKGDIGVGASTKNLLL
jgi:hypothetical protein